MYQYAVGLEDEEAVLSSSDSSEFEGDFDGELPHHDHEFYGKGEELWQNWLCHVAGATSTLSW